MFSNGHKMFQLFSEELQISKKNRKPWRAQHHDRAPTPTPLAHASAFLFRTMIDYLFSTVPAVEETTWYSGPVLRQYSCIE